MSEEIIVERITKTGKCVSKITMVNNGGRKDSAIRDLRVREKRKSTGEVSVSRSSASAEVTKNRLRIAKQRFDVANNVPKKVHSEEGESLAQTEQTAKKDCDSCCAEIIKEMGWQWRLDTDKDVAHFMGVLQAQIADTMAIRGYKNVSSKSMCMVQSCTNMHMGFMRLTNDCEYALPAFNARKWVGGSASKLEITMALANIHNLVIEKQSEFPAMRIIAQVMEKAKIVIRHATTMRIFLAYLWAMPRMVFVRPEGMAVSIEQLGVVSFTAKQNRIREWIAWTNQMRMDESIVRDEDYAGKKIAEKIVSQASKMAPVIIPANRVLPNELTEMVGVAGNGKASYFDKRDFKERMVKQYENISDNDTRYYLLESWLETVSGGNNKVEASVANYLKKIAKFARTSDLLIPWTIYTITMALMNLNSGYYIDHYSNEKLQRKPQVGLAHVMSMHTAVRNKAYATYKDKAPKFIREALNMNGRAQRVY